MSAAPVRLTSLAHGGGCGCKLAPAVLEGLLARESLGAPFADLLVGTETGDDAAVWRLEGDTCVIATTDFFMPIVDDPADFGRIAAANALSDVYAMGGRPIMALAILGMPLGKIAPETVREILAGGGEVCARAGIPVAGGHSIDAPEPIYGLAVIGTCKAHEVRRNAGAQPGDALILTKALGVGVYSAAIKQEALDADGYAEMLASTTRLNSVGTDLARDADVHAMTDVTGFGLLGHALEMARGSSLALVLEAGAIPLLARAAELARDGFVTGASQRNWSSYGGEVTLPAALPEWQRHLLTDPQTSGGLLVAVAAPRAEAVLATIRAAGYASAQIVGRVERGTGVRVVGAIGDGAA
ncbi:MAG TPA: selenide, water dikinase SelD [Gammaproteobacteria bacterium]